VRNDGGVEISGKNTLEFGAGATHKINQQDGTEKEVAN
jgi:hypothetical protein